MTLKNVRGRWWSSAARLTFGGVSDLTCEDPRAPTSGAPPIEAGWTISGWDVHPGGTSFTTARHVGPGDYDYRRFEVRHATFEQALRFDLRDSLRRLSRI